MFRDLNALELIKIWRRVVNNNVNAGRDGHLLKEYLAHTLSEIIVLGFYKYAGQGTITIPQFLRQAEDWYEEDETWARIELATLYTGVRLPDYNVYLENRLDPNPEYYQLSQTALISLKEWADRVLA